MNGAQTNVAHLVDPSTAETVEVLGPTIQYLTEPAGADGDPCLLRGTVPPGAIVPLHSHADPETFFALSGGLEGLTPEGWVALEPGDVFHVPGDARHAWRNRSPEPAVTLIVTTAKLGRFFREVATPSPPSEEAIERFLAVSERYGYWNATPAENAEVGLMLG